MSLPLNRRELLKRFAWGSAVIGAGGATTSSAPTSPQTARQRPAPSRVNFVRAPLLNGIIAHAGATSMELYHKHPHVETEEIVQPEDIRLQTRLVMRNHKEILDWLGLEWRNVVRLTRYQKRMDESKQIEEVLTSYFKDWRPAMTTYEIGGLSSPQARLEIDMWVMPGKTSVAAGPAIAPASPGIIKGIEPISPRPEVTDRTAFALGIKTTPDMDLIFFSGITSYPPEIDPWNPGTFRMPADAAERSKMATENLDRLLKAAGLTWQHIIFNVNYTAPPGSGGINFRSQSGDWSASSVALRVTDTGVPGSNVLYQITAASPHKAITTRWPARGIEPILHRPDATLRDLPLAPAIRVSRDVDLVFFPSVTAYPIDVDPWNPGSFRLPEDLAVQERMVADNIDRMLKAAGISWQHIILLTSTGDGRGLTTMRERLGDWRPCRTTRAVSTGIPGARLLCEITAASPRSA